MLMRAVEQNEFIKKFLEPAFERDKLRTIIIIFDNNCHHPEYSIEILNNTATKKYVDGSAFHIYLGEVDAMSKAHNIHYNKNIYFTEQWTSYCIQITLLAESIFNFLFVINNIWISKRLMIFYLFTKRK